MRARGPGAHFQTEHITSFQSNTHVPLIRESWAFAAKIQKITFNNIGKMQQDTLFQCYN